MKKYSIIVAVASALLLAGCFHKSDNSKPLTEQKPIESSDKNEQAAKEPDKDKDSSSTKDEDVKKIAMPIEQYEELSKEEITDFLKEEGAKNIQFSKEKTVVYEVPKKKYDEKKKTLQSELNEMITAVQQKDQYPSIQSVKVNQNYTHYQLTVDKEKFENSFDSLAVLSLMMSTLYYFSYIGDSAATIKVDYIDQNSNKAYKSQTYPEPVQ